MTRFARYQEQFLVVGIQFSVYLPAVSGISYRGSPLRLIRFEQAGSSFVS
jgi:hypothetical protein